ncbi:ferredoxin--NADP reductase, partial [bacterium]
LYYPTVTREAFRNRGRITTLIETGDIATANGLPALDPAADRFMLCGSPHMLDDCSRLLDARGFQVASKIGDPGDYVIERAFVEK